MCARWEMGPCCQAPTWFICRGQFSPHLQTHPHQIHPPQPSPCAGQAGPAKLVPLGALQRNTFFSGGRFGRGWGTRKVPTPQGVTSA